jgi:bifunctional N-acetylglucosamine-1-phosphate-uridyltransferase/glucosamine-1-phosphate-acetyltransferase GlmU-like protein
MIFTCHRINTIKELININNTYGIEVDLRDNTNGEIYLSHNPFIDGELFEDFLKFYNHSFIILNIKSERIEYKILDLLKKFNVTEYFFLDSSLPMIYKMSNEGINNIAIRFSEIESIETVLNFKNKVKWVWVDCFTKNPLNKKIFSLLKENNFNLCFVSPELQNQQNKLDEYKEYFKNNDLKLDMICTKSYNIKKWRTNLELIIPMSGIGKRFIEAGYKAPKPLIVVDNKLMVEHIVNLFPDENNIKFICNSYHLKNTNMMSILNKLNGKIYEVPYENRQGPVHAVSLIMEHISDDLEIIVSYCDYGTYWNYDQFLNYVRNNNLDGCVVCYKGFHPHMLGTDNYAFVKNDENLNLIEIQEKKPFTNNKMNEYASNGTYYFKNGKIMKKYFNKLIQNELKVNNEYYVSMVYNLMVKDHLKVGVYEIEHMLQWGTPYDLEIYNSWSSYFNDIIKEDTIKENIHLDTTLILPMAGFGSRFTKKNYELPKPLIDVNGLPMIIQAVNCLPETSNKVFIILEEHKKKYNIDKILKDYYENTNIIDISNVTNGQATTCYLGIKNLNLNLNLNLDKPILISACDNGVYYDKNEYNKLLNDESIDVIVWSFRNNPANKNNPNMYAWMEVDEKNNILNVSCKKFNKDKHNIKTSHVIIGTMFFRKAKYFMEGLELNYKHKITTNNEYYVDDVINQNIKNGLNVKVFEVKHYICWGTPDDYETYNYWKLFFDKCNWHNYKIHKDLTYN